MHPNDAQNDNKEQKRSYDFPVLIIDDDKWMHRLITNFLRKKGLEAISAMDPVEGLALAIKYRPIVIFLDMVMPITSGTVLLQMLKKIEITKHIPVIAVSGNFSQKLLTEAVNFGANSFVSKPFTQEILEEKLAKAIDEETLAKAAAMQDRKNQAATNDLKQ